MAFSIAQKDMIKYQPEHLRTFRLVMYEWIDNLNFTLKPEDCLPDAARYTDVVKELCLNAGWTGNGEVELIWIPPFMFGFQNPAYSTLGIIVWHVKQQEDGLSWILSPVELPYENELLR